MRRMNYCYGVYSLDNLGGNKLPWFISLCVNKERYSPTRFSVFYSCTQTKLDTFSSLFKRKRLLYLLNFICEYERDAMSKKAKKANLRSQGQRSYICTLYRSAYFLAGAHNGGFCNGCITKWCLQNSTYAFRI